MMKRLKRILKLDVSYSFLILGVMQSISLYYACKLGYNYSNYPIWKVVIGVVLLLSFDIVTGILFRNLESEVQKWKEFYERNNFKNDPKI